MKSLFFSRFNKNMIQNILYLTLIKNLFLEYNNHIIKIKFIYKRGGNDDRAGSQPYYF